MRAAVLIGMNNVVSLSSIDWSAAWFATLRPLAVQMLAEQPGEEIGQHADWREAANQRAKQMSLLNHRGLPIRFIAPEQTPDDLAYEACISHTGQVPTRNNLHDFFNALVWLRFPAIKRALNAAQAAAIARHGIQSSRGHLRDAATLFDENGALLVVRDDPVGTAMINALRDHDWQTLFVYCRREFHAGCEVRLFGHALCEKLTRPYKAIAAHAWCVRADASYFQLAPEEKLRWLDEQVAAQLQQRGDSWLHPTQFSPLPILGIPDWWPQQDAAFYQDATVFRNRPQR